MNFHSFVKITVLWKWPSEANWYLFKLKIIAIGCDKHTSVHFGGLQDATLQKHGYKYKLN